MDFIVQKQSDGSFVSSSIEKRGNDESGYCYIKNIKHMKNIDGQVHIIEKKQNILPSEYFQLLDQKDPTMRSLRVNRLVMIDFNHYYTLDYYPDVPGQPLLLIVKKGYQRKNNPTKLKFPPIEKLVPIYREVTNEKEYFPENLARMDYEMPEKDRLNTQLQSGAALLDRPHKRRTTT